MGNKLACLKGMDDPTLTIQVRANCCNRSISIHTQDPEEAVRLLAELQATLSRVPSPAQSVKEKTII